MRLLPSFSGFLYVWLCQTLLSRCVCNFVYPNVIKKCTCIFFQHVSEWDFDLTSFHASQNVHTKGGERWLRPAGVIQTTQAVCTDGHFDTKKAQETKTKGDQTPQSSPTGETALVRSEKVDPKKLHVWSPACRRDSGQRARYNPALHTFTTCQFPDALELSFRCIIL